MLDGTAQQDARRRALEAEMPLLEAEVRLRCLHREEQPLHRRERIDVLELRIARARARRDAAWSSLAKREIRWRERDRRRRRVPVA